MPSTSNIHPRRAFTLVEILIVVIIIGILAAIVIPQFSNASSDARTTNLRTTLATVRTQLDLFKAQHNDLPPQITGMWTLLTSLSDSTEVSVSNPTGTKLGPYLLSIPTNPINNQSSVTSAASDANAGWYYDPTLAAGGATFLARNVDGSINTQY